MSLRIRHATAPARPGPSQDRPPAPAPPPPPRWRTWLLPIGLLDHAPLAVHAARVEHADAQLQLFQVPLSGRRRQRSNRLDQPDGRHLGGPEEGGQLHQPDPCRHQRRFPGTHPEDPQGDRDRGGVLVEPARRRAVVRALLVADRPLRVDGPQHPSAAVGRDHGHRRIEGQGLRRVPALDPIRRRGRVRRGQARGGRGRRLPQAPRALRPGRCRGAPGGPHGGAARNG